MSYEDNYWGLLIGHYINSACRVNTALYHYYVNSHSTVTRRNQIAQLDRMKIEVMLLDEYQNRKFYTEEYEQIFDDFIELYYLNTWFIIFTRFDEIPDALSEMMEIITFYFPDYKERIAKKEFTYRTRLLIDMLIKTDVNNIYVVKLRWLQSWLKD